MGRDFCGPKTGSVKDEPCPMPQGGSLDRGRFLSCARNSVAATNLEPAVLGVEIVEKARDYDKRA
jgi:hypothetical protein